MQKERVLIVDVCRVIAITMVILSHVLITVSSSWPGAGQPSFGLYPFLWNTWGEVGVTLFLIISGFGLGYTYRGRQVELKGFLLRRIVRIYPVYYLSLILALSIHIGFAVRGALLLDEPFIILPKFGYADFVLALTGFNAFFGKWGGPLVWSSWYIGLIMTMYLCYPLIAQGLKRAPWLFVGILFVVSYVSRILVSDAEMFSGNQMHWFPLNRVFEFGVGVAFEQAIPQAVLLKLNEVLRGIKSLPFWGDLSFPLFLIHDPLRRFIVWGPSNVYSDVIGIVVFIALSIGISIAVLNLNGRIERMIRERSRAQFQCQSN